MFNFRGMFLFEFLAVFPFNLILHSNTSLWARLIRLFRLPRLVKLLDQEKFNQMIKSFTGAADSSGREDKLVAQYMMMHIYRIYRLAIIALLITYFVGCLWYFLSSSLNNAEDVLNRSTFNTNFNLDLNTTTDVTRLVVSCYFVLTTLSTVGYGDFYPISNIEWLVSVLIMLCGVAFFSYIMNSFIDILQNYERKMGAVDKSTDLQVWLVVLTRFTRQSKTHLTKSLLT